MAFIVRIFHVCTEKQSAVKPCDVIGGKEESVLIVMSSRNTQSSLSLPYRLFTFRADTTSFLFNFIFENLKLHILLITVIIIPCSRMIRVLSTAALDAQIGTRNKTGRNYQFENNVPFAVGKSERSVLVLHWSKSFVLGRKLFLLGTDH